MAHRHLAWAAGHQSHQRPHWTLRNLQRQWLGANLLEGTAPLMPETLWAAKKRAKEVTLALTSCSQSACTLDSLDQGLQSS